MNSELEDLELDALLQDIEKDANELDQMCSEMEQQLDFEFECLDKLIEEFNYLQLKKIKENQYNTEKDTPVNLEYLARELKAALDKISSHFNEHILNTRNFFTIIKKIWIRLAKVKTIQINQDLYLNFKYLNESFQKIKHKNHVVMLQPRLQSINSIKV